MEDWTNLKDIWQSVEVKGLPDAEEAVKLIKRYRFKIILKKAAKLFLLLLMIILIIYVVSSGHKMISTKIGVVGFFIGIFVILISNLNSLKRAFAQVNCNNQEFIEYLMQAQHGRAFFYQKVQPVIFLMLSGSLFLLFFESLYEQPVLMVVIYSILAIYFATMWFFVRPRFIKNQTEKLKETIAKLESLSK